MGAANCPTMNSAGEESSTTTTAAHVLGNFSIDSILSKSHSKRCNQTSTVQAQNPLHGGQARGERSTLEISSEPKQHETGR